MLPLHHGLEMLLKAVVWQERRQIAPRGHRAYSFDASIGIVQASGHLDEDDARTLRMIGAHRDAVQHAGSAMSHEMICIDAMAGLFLADKLLQSAFGSRLADEEPFASRPLPLTSQPPRDYTVLVSTELEAIRRLLAPRSRRRHEAITRLRPFAVADVVASGREDNLDAGDMEGLAKRLQQGEAWTNIFPGLAGVAVDSSPDITYGFKIVKRGEDALPVRLVKDGDPEAAEAVVAREVDWFERYPFGLHELGRHAGLNQYEIRAVAFYLGLKGDERCFSSRSVGKGAALERFSHEALKRARDVAASPRDLQSARSALREHDAEKRRAGRSR